MKRCIAPGCVDGIITHDNGEETICEECQGTGEVPERTWKEQMDELYADDYNDEKRLEEIERAAQDAEKDS